MSWLGRLRRQKAGPIPSRVDDLLGHPAVEIHVLARAVLSLQVQNAMLIDQHRAIVGRLDVLEGKANSTMGDSRERISELRELNRV